MLCVIGTNTRTVPSRRLFFGTLSRDFFSKKKARLFIAQLKTNKTKMKTSAHTSKQNRKRKCPDDGDAVVDGDDDDAAGLGEKDQQQEEDDHEDDDQDGDQKDEDATAVPPVCLLQPEIQRKIRRLVLADALCVWQLQLVRKPSSKSASSTPPPLYKVNEDAAYQALYCRVRKNPSISTVFSDMTGSDADQETSLHLQSRVLQVYRDAHDGMPPSRRNVSMVQRNGAYKFEQEDGPLIFAVVWHYCVTWEYNVRNRFVFLLPHDVARQKLALISESESADQRAFKHRIPRYCFWSSGDADRIRDEQRNLERTRAQAESRKQSIAIMRSFLHGGRPGEHLLRRVTSQTKVDD